MKRIGLAIALILGVTLLGGAGVASAHSFRTGDVTTVEKTEVVDHTLFAAGNTVDIQGTVNGDVFCAGRNVTVTGVVHGDVLCVGQTVRVSGQVDGSVRLAGQSVNLSGMVGRNASIAGQAVVVESGAKIAGDLSSAGSMVTLDGSAGRDVALAGTESTITGAVGRDVNNAGERLVVTKGASIGGALTYQSKNQADIESGAHIVGPTRHTQPPQKVDNEGNMLAHWSLPWAIYLFISMLLLAMVVALVFPRPLHVASRHAIDHLGMTLLTGVVAFVVAPIAIVACMLTVIGLPLGFLLLLSWVTIMILSGPLFAYYIGRVVLDKSRNPLLIMFVGAVIVLALYIIPVVGFFVGLIAMIMGGGMVLREGFTRFVKPSYEIKD